jgi:hypothetical protein
MGRRPVGIGSVKKKKEKVGVYLPDIGIELLIS